MPSRQLRHDSSPEELLRALNEAIGKLLEVVDVPLQPLAQSRKERLRYVRGLVAIRLRQAGDENVPGDHGSGPE